ncbi:xanthine permease [Acinetobacter sp. WCHAc010052]|nr:xanthine permease [Acinetobacter sp. WCHAc010052]
MTTSGYIFVICFFLLVIWSRWLAIRLIRKSNTDTSEKITLSTYIFPALIIFVISSLVIPFSFFIPQSVYNLFSKPAYEATIQRYSSEWVNNPGKGGNRILMYHSYVSFQTEDGIVHKDIPTDIRSGGRPVIGDKVTIVYTPGDKRVGEKSARSGLLLFAGGLMTFMMAMVLYTLFSYAMNFKTKSLGNLWSFLLLRVMIPFATFGMFALLLSVVYKYIFLGNPANDPVIVPILCGFFAFSLLPLMILLVRPRSKHTE